MTDTAVLAYVHNHELPYSFFDSHRRLVAHDLLNHHRLRAGELGVRYGAGGIIEARNKAVAAYLTLDAPWFLWLDTDMGYAGDTLDRLIDSADPVERPIMGGLCFSSKEVGADGLGGAITFPVPTVFDIAVGPDDAAGYLPRLDYEPDTVTKAAATGSACILIHRSVFEKIRETDGDHWYSPVTVAETGAQLSEDLSFCARAARSGFPVHINTGVRTTHYKPVWLGEMHFQIYRDALGRGSDIERRAIGIRSDQ